MYIGKADRPRRRYQEHYWELPDDRSRKAHWLRKLLALGLKPTLEILREVPRDSWEVWERAFIHWYRVLGWRVVNTSDGGEGLQNPTAEVRAKCGLGFKGRHHTPEARAAIGVAFKGKRLSAEHRAKISAYRQLEKASGRKRKLSAAHRANISNSNPWKGKRMTAERRARYIEARNRRATLTSMDSCAFLFL